jgi:GH18 family chitinase
MKNSRMLPATLTALVLLLMSGLAYAKNTVVTPMPEVIAYVPNWGDLTAFADTIEYAKVTQINLAFENPVDDQGDLSFDGKDAVLIAKAHAHHVPVLISLGGGGASEDKTLLARYAGLLTDAQRAGFVAKVAEYVGMHGFDGLDVDLEGPAIGKDYGAFIHDLARALKPSGKRLTAALSQGYGRDQVPASVFQDLDFVNIMAYDATGTWSPNSPGQHSSLAFAQSSVAYWLGRGLPKAKAVLGVPFYGYGFGEAFRKWGYSYAEIVAAYPGAADLDQVGTTIWYNGRPTIRAKAQYVRDQGLAGVMIWSLDSDAKGDRSLLSAIDETLHPKPAPSAAHGKP